MASHFQYKMGEELIAKVVEVFTPAILIVDIDGKLFRVINQTGQLWNVQDAITLRVSGLNPPEFQIQRRKRGFDRIA